MTGKAIAILAFEIALGVLYLGSIVFLNRNSTDFILARRATTLSVLAPGQTIRFGTPLGDSASLLGDWLPLEPWGVWMDRRRTELALKPPAGTPLFLALSGRFLIPGADGQHLDVGLDGRPLAAVAVAGAPGIVTCSWTIPLPPRAAPLSVLGFEVGQPMAPVDIGAGSDQRLVGFGLATLTPVSAASPAACDHGATIDVTPSG